MPTRIVPAILAAALSAVFAFPPANAQQPPIVPPAQLPPAPDPVRVGERFEEVARKVSPAVVYVEAVKPAKASSGSGGKKSAAFGNLGICREAREELLEGHRDESGGVGANGRSHCACNTLGHLHADECVEMNDLALVAHDAERVRGAAVGHHDG